MKHRIFVSIDIPEELKKVAEAHIGLFYKNNLARVVEKENWHITVVFCGYLTDEELNKLKETAKNIAHETKKFELIPDKIIFAPPKRPRMVWLIFKHSPEFSKLSRQFSGFSQNNHESLSHLTLVRFEEKHYPALKKLLPGNGIDPVRDRSSMTTDGFRRNPVSNGVDIKNETKSFIVESINIMESHLSRNGPSYELIEKINLQ